MRIRAAAIAILATASLAHADVRTREETAAVSMSYTPWELRFPGAGWMLEQQRRAGGDAERTDDHAMARAKSPAGRRTSTAMTIT